MNLTPPGTLYKWNHTVFVFFCDWLIALSIMSARAIHVVARVRRFFLLQKPNSIPLNVYTTFRLSTRSSVDTWVASAIRKSSHFPSAAVFSPLRASVPSSAFPYVETSTFTGFCTSAAFPTSSPVSRLACWESQETPHAALGSSGVR